MNIARGLISRLPQMAGGVSALAVAWRHRLTVPAAQIVTGMKKYISVGCFLLSPLISHPSPPVEAGHAGIKFSRIEGVMNEVVTEGWHFRSVVVLSRQHQFFLFFSFFLIFGLRLFFRIPWFEYPHIYNIQKRARVFESAHRSEATNGRSARGSIFPPTPWSSGRHQGLTDGQHQPPCAPHPTRAGWPRLHRTFGPEYDDKAPSFHRDNERRSSGVARCNANMLITQREGVSRNIRWEPRTRARTHANG
jgi:hypothetical protein